VLRDLLQPRILDFGRSLSLTLEDQVDRVPSLQHQPNHVIEEPQVSA
jgi:hypothetical protein